MCTVSNGVYIKRKNINYGYEVTKVTFLFLKNKKGSI
jgi:hypothetical protein